MPSVASTIPGAVELSEVPRETPEVTETPEATETPAVTETPDMTGTPESTEEVGARAGCEGNPGTAPSPLAGLADLYAVDEATVMDYWCQGFGIGEIKKALTWAELTGTDAQTLFDMKKEGMGWGQIAKALGIHPGSKPDKDYGKPENPGKSGEHGNPNKSGDSGDDEQGEDESDGI
jgi:hypothetical protein